MYTNLGEEIYKPKKRISYKFLFTIFLIICLYIGYKLYSGYQIAKEHNFYQIPDFSQIEQPKEEIKNCEETLKELKIKNTCEEVKKIVNAFNGDKTMVMIIMHESNFNRLAVYKNKDKNGKVWSEDKGVFQINSYFHPELNGDIDHSISIAKQCYKSLGYNCWSAYKNGGYKSHETQANLLLNNL